MLVFIVNSQFTVENYLLPSIAKQYFPILLHFNHRGFGFRYEDKLKFLNREEKV